MRAKIFRGAWIALALVATGAPAYAIIGRPFTPMSYAGVARRTVRRSAYVGAAVRAPYVAPAPYIAPAPYVAPAPVVAPAAAPLSALPPGCTPGVSCNGVVYQPEYQGTSVVYVPR
jgi:hypothetical protein